MDMDVPQYIATVTKEKKRINITLLKRGKRHNEM